MGRNDAAAIDPSRVTWQAFTRSTRRTYNAVLHGCINTADDLDAPDHAAAGPQAGEISPIERASMWIGVYEFMHRGRALARGAQ